MQHDVSGILSEWPHDPDEMQVRIVRGNDGKEKLQVRIDLGILQMELDGRPDGERPNGFESLLEYFESEVRRLEAEGASLALDSTAIAGLLREGLQYYHRYVALFHLERFEPVARDTERNLRLFAFVKQHAVRMADRLAFDQYRPYVTMMLARARGMAAIQKNDHTAALRHVDRGIQAVQAFLVEYDQAERAAECKELAFLVEWRKQIESQRPVSPLERLEMELELAVKQERFEDAARLRDQLRRSRGEGKNQPRAT
jgi:hypothetical protein